MARIYGVGIVGMGWVSLHNALNSHEACFAAEISSREGRPVHIEELRSQFATVPM